MGNKPAKQENAQNKEVLLKIVPPLDHAYVRWLARDLERIYGFTPRNPRAIKPPDHYIEYMRMNGLLDVNLDDPDLVRLFKFHRDVKPSNVLIFDDDVAKIADFDLSNQAPDMVARLHSTRVLGTLGYHAPGLNGLNSILIINSGVLVKYQNKRKLD
ncbi:uncharacterized protein Fot_34239 [Forsythia ovata]|uniref:Protein kinase domain-containing protein n=1 Tax=Forsythia ovata TaxID=205694 RepID=A0ABD1SI29_9LAMI